jgi:hypothetical protein
MLFHLNVRPSRLSVIDSYFGSRVIGHHIVWMVVVTWLPKSTVPPRPFTESVGSAMVRIGLVDDGVTEWMGWMALSMTSRPGEWTTSSPCPRGSPQDRKHP